MQAIGGLERGIRGEQLGHVRLGTELLARIAERRGLEAHEVGRTDVHVGAGDGELDALVLRDRPVENNALAAVFLRPVNEPVAVTDAFGGNQRALRIEARQDRLEALSLLADQVFGRDPRDRRRTPRWSRG